MYNSYRVVSELTLQKKFKKFTDTNTFLCTMISKVEAS